jgi:hypothetical protein
MPGNASRRPHRGGAMFWGLVLIAAGVWFLLNAMGIHTPGMGAMWPIFPTLVGMGLFGVWLFSSNKREAAGIAIPATINLLIGLFFFAFTLKVFHWGDMAFLWPVFPLIVGISFIVAWILSLFREWGFLIPGGIVSAVGIIGLTFTMAGQNLWFLATILRWWPLILIALGIAILLRALFRPGGSERLSIPEGGPAEPDEPVQAAGLEDIEPGQPAGPETVAQEYKRKDE